MYLVRSRLDVGSQQMTGTFTGIVFADPVLPADSGVVINNVFFAPGARTYWHRHERGQLLVVRVGRGFICSEGQDPSLLREGDTVWVPPMEMHWHGGTASTCVLHMATSFGATEWFGEVSAEAYEAAGTAT